MPSKSAYLLAFALALGCGTDTKTDANGRKGDAGAQGGMGTTGARDASSVDGGVGGAHPIGTGSGGGSSGGTSSPPTIPDASIVHGGPGCGLPAAAFCETFDAPSATKGRAGELDPRKWSSGRLAPQLPSGNGCAIGIGPGTVPACRAGLPATVFPDQDTLICDPTKGVANSHLLVITAAQNYGQNSYRIRQPFDFAGRTGKIVFDAEGFIAGGLLGWISLEITEDPINAPCFSIGAPGTNNNEGSLIPKNAVEIQFQNTCGGYAMPPAFSLSMIDVLKDYQDTVLNPPTPHCLLTARGQLNHFEIAISEKNIDVSASPVSADGSMFEPVQLLFSTKVDLPFSRGWVQITTHNHATLKYSGPGKGQGSNEVLDAWTARWDNVGFDGPVLSQWREYEIPNSLTPGKDAWNRSGPVENIGYLVADTDKGPKDTLHFKDVDVSAVDTARLSLSGWYLNQGDKPASTFVLRYRFNGKTWRDRPLTDGELALLTGTHTQGQLGQMIDVPVSDLVQGDNTLEFVTVNVPQNYPPIVANIDLVLTTK